VITGEVGLWAGTLDAAPLAAVRTAALAAEDLGYGTLWFPEALGREAMTQAALLLAATTRITVATGVANIYARAGVAATAAQRTLDEAFPGRFVLGLGVGHPSLVEDARGHRFGPPLAAMRSYLDGWGAGTLPRPIIAALGPRMTALAADRAAGAHPLGMPVEHTRASRAILGPDRLLAVTVLVVPGGGTEGDGLARAAAEALMPNRHALLRDLGHRDGLDDRLLGALVTRGGPAAVAERVAAHRDAGADHVSLHVLSTTPQIPPVREWETLAAAW
jgi:probable F420-dependent oxidoreductase